MAVRILISIVAALGLSACASSRKAPATARASVTIAAEEPVPTEWRQVAATEDAARIGELDARWAAARMQSERRFAKAVAAEGTLLDAGAGLDRPEPSPGRYRCRTVRIGSAKTGPRVSEFQRFKPFFCFVATQGKLLSFTKATGTQRPGGWLWADGDRRLVFLGGVAQGARGEPPPYRTGAASNAIGVLERIGDFRWRLVLAGAAATSQLDVIELVPDTPPPDAPAS